MRVFSIDVSLTTTNTRSSSSRRNRRRRLPSSSSLAFALLGFFSFFSSSPSSSSSGTVRRFIFVSAGISTPKSENEYSEEFFLAHKKNEDAYPILVNLMASIVEQQEEENQQQYDEQQSKSRSQQRRQPFTVLDVGCGHGLLVEAWRDTGIAEESFCIEGSKSAAVMWPPQHRDRYYQIMDLSDLSAVSSAAVDNTVVKIPKTDVVTSFEVAEHLPESSAANFVHLLVTHDPSFVFFGAATVDQDLGQNPSHVNEQPFSYWLKKFKSVGYVPDVVTTAKAKLALLTNPNHALQRAWWYSKNIWIFVPQHRQNDLDTKILHDVPSNVNMLDPRYLHAKGGDQHLFGRMWKRDWTEFGTIFHKIRSEAAARQQLAGKEKTKQHQDL